MNSYRNKVCSNCKFSEVFQSENYKGSPADAGLVMCRRYPAVVLRDADKLVTRWPVVPASSWCGEWQAA